MNLNFFTATFPYKTGEPIIENELPILANHFDSIRIFPHVFEKNDKKRSIPSNCEVVQLSSFENLKLQKSYFVLLFIFFFVELFYAPSLKYYMKNHKKWLSLLKIAAKKAQYIESNKLLLPDAVNYSFWMNDWALVLTFLKKRSVISNFVFRCGGFDIWDERHEGNYLPFRYLIYKYADKGYPNAQIAEKYMKAKTPFATKIETKYLGTTDKGVNPSPDNEPFTLVSVSSLIPLKRVDLIIEILTKISTPIRWIHLGDGSEMEMLKSKSEENLQKHQVEFRGNVSNTELMQFFQDTPVNLFITTSSTESLPVSIQEAISFGIPVVATDVGGISEIVNTKTGFLIEKAFDIDEVAKLIERLINNKSELSQLRKSSRKFWEENFNAQVVYNNFAHDLTQFVKPI